MATDWSALRRDMRALADETGCLYTDSDYGNGKLTRHLEVCPGRAVDAERAAVLSRRFFDFALSSPARLSVVTEKIVAPRWSVRLYACSAPPPVDGDPASTGVA